MQRNNYVKSFAGLKGSILRLLLQGPDVLTVKLRVVMGGKFSYASNFNTTLAPAYLHATVAGMLSGGGKMGVFYLIRYILNGKFSGYELWSLHPFIWSVTLSAVVMVLVTRITEPPQTGLLEKIFRQNCKFRLNSLSA